MTYNVSMGTLNPTIPYHTYVYICMYVFTVLTVETDVFDAAVLPLFV